MPAAIETLHEGGIAVITMVSDVTPSRRLHCIGIDNLAAGWVAMIADSLALRDLNERAPGFTQVMQQDYPHLALLPAVEAPDDGPRAAGLIRSLLAEHPDLIGIYSIGAGNLLCGTFDAILHQQVSSDVSVAVEAPMAASRGLTGHIPAPIGIDIVLRDNIS